MKILMTAAMNEELEPLIQLLHAKQIDTLGNIKYQAWQTTINNNELMLAVSGIGKVSSTVYMSFACQHFQPDLVINIGSAGSLNNAIPVGCTLFAKHLLYHDVDVTAFGYKYGQVPGMPEQYYPSKLYTDHFYQSLTCSKHHGVILSGDSFISDQEILNALRLKFPYADAIDMESCAIAQMCHLINVPFVVMRTITDGSNNNAKTDHETNLTPTTSDTAVSICDALHTL